MNITNLNNISTIKSYLDGLFIEYSTQMGKRPETAYKPSQP